MVLIVDTFEVPSVVISKRLFRSERVKELGDVSAGTIKRVLRTPGVYGMHRECFDDMDIARMRYYFNEVVEVFGNVVYVNKSKRTVKHYSIVRDGDGVVVDLSEIRDEESSGEGRDKTGFLPHVKAQEAEIVVFPEDEDED